MENKLSTIYGDSTNKNCLMTAMHCGDFMEEVSSDNIIPDTVADIETVLLCTASPKIEGYYANGNHIDVEGTVSYTSLLMTDGGDLLSLTFDEPFDTRYEADADVSDCRIVLFPTVESAEARLVNPRKLNLHAKIDMVLRVLSPTSPEPIVSGTESLEDDMNLQRDLMDVTTVAVETVEERNVSASLDVELDSNDPPAAEIIMCRVQLTPSEVKTRDDEADVRMDAIATLIYRTEEGNCFEAERRISLEKSVALPFHGAWEWMCTAAPHDVTAQIAANGYGEMKVIELDFNYDLLLATWRNEATQAVSDMYSVEYETESDLRNLSVIRLQRVYATGLSVNASSTREALDAGDARSVLTGSASLRDITVSYRRDKNKLVAEGHADITLICENHGMEEASPYTSHTISQPFRCEMDAGEGAVEGEYLPDCHISAIKFRLDSTNVYADLELSIRVIAFANEDVSCLKSITLYHDRPIDRRCAPMTLCYPSGKERLWDIAKYYRITEESILTSNGMTERDISDKKVILIPRHSPKKPLFTKVI